MMHAIPEELLCLQGKLTLSKFKSSKRSHKSQYQTPLICWYDEHPHKVTESYKQYLRSYHVHKAAWPQASLKVQKGHTKINIKLGWNFDEENISHCVKFTRQPELVQIWKFKKVTQRSTSKESKILMWRTLLSSYNLIQAIFNSYWPDMREWPEV